MVLGDTKPRAANTWVSTWTGKQLVEPPQALDEPRAKMVCVRRSRGETDALANSDAGKQAQLKTTDWVNTNRWMILMKRSQKSIANCRQDKSTANCRQDKSIANCRQDKSIANRQSE